MPAPSTIAAAARPPAPASTVTKTGPLAAWLPLLLTLALMPVLAWATMNFLILPKLQRTFAQPVTEESAAYGSQPADDKSAATAKKDNRPKVLAPLSKVLVNVSGTGGARYLIVSMTLVGNTPEFKTRVEENKDQLLDAAASTLASKSIIDLERSGARNLIRSELVAIFNTVLKATPVQDIYLTEFAVQ